ncbi:hypothetical protein MIZ01_1674 [Sideroxyarcus emersonii]|uniref:PAS domain S-box protein n=1 Tax=Sideroxyarcus emersonii TaxID=2764705 RepID=A0AAN2BZJ9_9PROT|nr:PAS domain S-box protein [Sideroxyarcus emersonii]BCK87877.1 hypothetical protein MIZ01_1674 [Sideroxyarcus emersonii]
MGNALKKLQDELEAAQRSLAEAETRYVHQEAEHQAALKEAENVRKQIEQAHQEWISALDVVEDPIFVHDKDFHILRCNQAYQRCAGIPFKQIIGQPYYEVFPQTHAPLPNCLRALEKETASEVEEEVLIGDITYRSRAHSIIDGLGNYLYSVHTLENINERQRAHRELQESEIRYRRLFEAAKDGILILDAESGKIMDANPFILDLLSYSLSECAGKMLWEIGLFKDIETSKTAFRELQAKKYIRYEDLPLKTKNGQQIDVEFVSNFYEVGERKVIQCNIRDITERMRVKKLLQESEQQYRRLFEAAKDGILILDAESGKIMDANPFILDLLSYSLSECAGKMLWEIGLFKDIETSKTAFLELQTKGYIRYEDLPLKTKDGRQVDVELISNLYEVGARKLIQCNIRDISASLHAKELLIASRDLLQSVMENTPVRVFWKDTELRYLGCNNAFAHDAGMSCSEDLIGKDDFQMGWRERAEFYRADDQQVIDSGMPKLGYEEPQITPDGRTIWLRTSKVPLRATDGRIFGLLGIYEDITERREVEKNLKLFRALLDNSSDAIEVLDPVTLRFLDVNETECGDLGYSRDELLAMRISDIDQGFDEGSGKLIEKQIQSTEGARFDSMHRRKDGSTFPVEVSAKLVVLDKPYLLSIARDITERKRAEAKLRESEEKFRAIFDHARDGIIVMDVDERSVKFSNSSMEQMLGYGPGELIGLNMAKLHPPEALAQVSKQFDRDAQGEISKVQDMPMLTKDNRILYADLNGSPVDIAGHRYLLGVFRDATERRAGEMKLRLANRALKTLSAGNLALVRATKEDELLRSVTGIIVKHSGYRMAAVYYAEDDSMKSIKPIAWAGIEDSYYAEQHLSWAGTGPNQLPLIKAIHSGTTQICHDIIKAPEFKPWRDSVLARGYVSNIALPLRDDEHTFGGLSIYSSEAEAFDEEEVRLLEELANDLAYGIITLRTRKAHEQHAIILRQSLEQSIQTIASTVEARDPYTAGHQRRVGELAEAISREMGLPDEQINGIHLAAIIHDLGKIHVPAEILSKPGKLTEIEYMLIKTHPQDGYNILKDVKFPWPIADIVLQHHERMDGSGYPQGLKGDAILLEARILCVADVVEAMSSHRPYRPGLGIDAALDEITRGRGSHYDSQVVDACSRLIREHGYVIPT